MAPLEFSFGEFDDELGAIQRFAEKFIRPDSLGVLPRLSYDLKNARRAASDREVPWTIPANAPLRTKTSNGEFVPSGEGGRRVYGEISSIWQIKPLRARGHERQPAQRFALVGKASTCVRIYEEPATGEPVEIAMWRMEIADDASPGAFFHVQVLGQDPKPPFPEFLSIPRFPTLMFTPMLTLDFLLGELFQSAWPRNVSGSKYRGDVERWRGIQTTRLLKLLSWQVKELENGTNAPLTLMKALQPPSDLFLD